MTRSCAALAALLVTAGCQGPTTALVEVRLGPGAAAPASLRVNVHDPSGRIAPEHSVQMPSLPGTLVIQALPDVDQVVRVIVRGESTGAATLGGERIAIRAHQQTRVVVTLTADRADADGDFVPDDLDVCPSDGDPDQRDADGDGRGDVCAGGGDAGMPDLAEPDLSGADLSGDMTNGPSCATAGVALCDDFEAATINSRWFQVKKNATITIDSTRAFRGTRSLRFHTNAVDAGVESQGEIYEDQTFLPTPMPDFFVRVYLFMPTPAPMDDVPRLMGALQAGSPYEGISINLENGRFTAFNSIPSPSVFKGSTTNLPTNQWACVEWEVKIGTPGLIKVWLNDVEITAIGGAQDTAIVPPMEQIVLGYYFFAPPVPLPARDLWLDEVIVDGQRIGCAK